MSLFESIWRGVMELERMPPLALFRALHTCIGELEELEPIEDDVVITKTIEALIGLFAYLPENFFVPRDEFIKQAEEPEEYVKQLPQMPSVPLYDILTNCGEAILDLAGPFFNKDIVAKGLCSKLRKQLMENENAASGMSQIDRILGKKQIVGSDENDRPPEELVRIYLRHTPFYPLLHTDIPFIISKKALSEHCFIVAKPGHGKTQLLGSFVAQFLNDPSKPGVFCLDPAGDWFEIIRDRVDPSRLVVLDPETDPPALNFFDFKNSTEAATLQSFTYLMSSLSGGLSDKQSNITPYLLKLLRQIPGASLETLRELVDERPKKPEQSKFAETISKLPPKERDFFQHQFYTSHIQVTKDAIAIKIYGAMSSAAFEKMFSATENSFDAHAAMRERKVVLARGSELTLGEHGLSVFLQYVVSQFFLASLARFRIPQRERHQCYLLCDEAAHIYNHQTHRVLVECRKLGLSFFSATQLIENIPTEVKASIYGATSVKAAGKVSFSDANLLAREMRTTPDFIQNMKTFEWAFYVADADKAMKVRVPPGMLEAMPKRGAPDFQTKGIPPADEPVVPDEVSVSPAQRSDEQAPRDADLPRAEPAPKPAESDKPSDPDEPLIKPGKEWD